MDIRSNGHTVTRASSVSIKTSSSAKSPSTSESLEMLMRIVRAFFAIGYKYTPTQSVPAGPSASLETKRRSLTA